MVKCRDGDDEMERCPTLLKLLYATIACPSSIQAAPYYYPLT
jgi:hypothetical protein